MQYHNITKDDMLNGDGLRVVLWVAGCGHACPGCHNPITWDENGGLPFDEAAKEEIFTELAKDYVSGVTFSGGDPLYPANREQVGALAREVHARFPEKTIWLYTGYRWEQIADLPFLDAIDVIVPHGAEEHRPSLPRQRQSARDRCSAYPGDRHGLSA